MDNPALQSILVCDRGRPAVGNQFVDCLPQVIEGYPLADMRGNGRKNIPPVKSVRRTFSPVFFVVQAYRLEIPVLNQQGKDAVVGPDIILVAHLEGHRLTFGAHPRIDHDKVNGSVREQGGGIFYHPRTRHNILGRNIVRNVDHAYVR